jgi:hypothetical protein
VEAVKARTEALLSGKGKDVAEEDPDLQRAKDLIDLHYMVKVKHVRSGGVDEELEDVRHAVDVAMREMGQL